MELTLKPYLFLHALREILAKWSDAKGEVKGYWTFSGCSYISSCIDKRIIYELLSKATGFRRQVLRRDSLGYPDIMLFSKFGLMKCY